METEVLIYRDEDKTKQGKFKKSFIEKWISKEEFFKYLKDNNFKIASAYIDIIGSIINTDKKFKCSYGGFVIGTSGIVKEYEGIKENPHADNHLQIAQYKAIEELFFNALNILMADLKNKFQNSN